MRDFASKIEKLRKIYIGPGNAEAIDKFSEQLQKLLSKNALVDRDDVKGIVELAKKRVAGIDALLANNAELTEMGRARLFGEKDALQFWISNFDGEYLENEAKKLEKTVDEKLK